MQIAFIRHSKTLIEPQEPIVLWGLSDEGIVRAKSLSANDVIKGIQVMYSSLQTKALETALYLAKPNGIPIRTNNDFTEITSFTNKFIADKEDYEQNLHDFYHDIIERIAEGETHEEALKRFNQALEQVIAEEAKNDVEKIGIISHGYILSYFTAEYVDNTTPYDLHKKIQMPDVAVLDWDKKRFISLWGETLQ